MALRTVNLANVRASETVRSHISTMYGAAMRGQGATSLLNSLRTAGIPAGNTQQFLAMYRAVNANVQRSAGVRFARSDYRPFEHPQSVVPSRLKTIHRYQATIELRGAGGAKRYMTIATDDATLTKQEIVDRAKEIADREGYSGEAGIVPQGGWTSGVWVMGRSTEVG